MASPKSEIGAGEPAPASPQERPTESTAQGVAADPVAALADAFRALNAMDRARLIAALLEGNGKG
ncbi:MAG: hypothetical protein AMXMBFR84_16580 [Candidatus Hydrogenedentota bacterium]